uniref:Ran-binding protein 3-like n=1 Tax=Cyprinus carpio TaxID=7962 RepID=A0A8C1X6S8_CYPCA
YLVFHLAEKPDVAPPVFVFQKDKAQKRSAEGSSTEDGEDSDKEDGGYSPAAKRGRRSPFTQFPPSHTVSKNNVFMPSSFCPSPTGNSDSEPEEKTVGFRLKPPTLIHGQAPSTGVPSPKPKEAQRSILRPPVLQPPPARSPPQRYMSSLDTLLNLNDIFVISFKVKNNSTFEDKTEDKTEVAPVEGSFVFGQNMKDRAKVCDTMKESLEESAARHEAHKPQKCLLERVEVRTGEESESNVLQMQCKLFMFEMTSQSWVERGCGVLRLNDIASDDDGTLQSRLVMRTQGSLRVILNTKLWPQMQVDKASEKSLRITAMDTEEQDVKVFLISSSSKDAAQLFAALHHRILALRSISGQESDGRPAIRFSDDDESRTPPTSATPAPGNLEAGVCPSTGDT